MDEERIFTADPDGEVWNRLLTLQAVPVAEDMVRRVADGEGNGSITYRAQLISFAIAQAYEFYQSAISCSALTGPLLLQYGMLNLSKVLILASSPASTKQLLSSMQKHGIELSVQEENRTGLEALTVNVKQYGTFTQLATVLGETYRPGTAFVLRDLLSALPEMSDMYRLVYGRPPRTVKCARTKYGWQLDHHDELQTFIENLVDREKVKGYHFHNGQEDGSYHAIMESTAVQEDLEVLGYVVHTAQGQPYFRFGLRCGDYIYLPSELTLHYLLMFGFGMMARYQPVKWGEMTDRRCREGHLVAAFLDVSRRRFPHLVLNRLFQKKFRFLPSYYEETSLDEEELYENFTRNLEKEIWSVAGR